MWDLSPVSDGPLAGLSLDEAQYSCGADLFFENPPGFKCQLSPEEVEGMGCCQTSKDDIKCAANEYVNGTCIVLTGRKISCNYPAQWHGKKTYDPTSGECRWSTNKRSTDGFVPWPKERPVERNR